MLGWYGTALDIHDTKQLEQESTRLATRLNDTLESITDGFFILDRDWHFSFLNAQAEKLLQRNRADLLGKVLWDEFPDAVTNSFHTNYTSALERNISVHFQEYYPAPLNRWRV